MVLVVSPFGCPFENFTFDDAGVGAESAYRVDAAQSFGDALIPQSDGCSVDMRGEKELWDSDRRVIRKAVTKDIRSGS